MLLRALLFPITGPFLLARLALEQVHLVVERELFDVKIIQERLLQLHMAYEMGELSDEAYAEAEQALLDRLKAAMARSAREGVQKETDNHVDFAQP